MKSPLGTPKEVPYQNKGYALFLLKHYEEALLAYEQALHEDPEDQGPYVGKAETLHELGRQEELLALYEQAKQRILHPLAKARLLRLVGREEGAEQLEQQTHHAQQP
jgi:tetratricopeptide (TPR) repeat protein